MEVNAENVRRAKIELARRAKLKLYQTRPELWYAERFGGKTTDIKWTDFPGYADHKWDGTPDPFYTMFTSLANWKNVAIESATSTGKTWSAARVMYWFLDCFPDSLVVTTAPKEKQLKAVLWAEISACFGRFKKLRPKAEMFDLRVLPDGTKIKFGRNFWVPIDDDSASELHQAIGVVSGVRAGEESATKMQGFHRKYMLFIVEEAAGVPHPVMTAIKNTCTGEHNVILAIGNPDSVTDALHQFAELSHVEHVTISAYDHPNIVLKRTIIDGAVSQKSIDIRRKEYGEDSNLFRSRVRGIAPEQSSDSLILRSWIFECAKFHAQYKGVADDPQSYNAVGVDVANSMNGDAAALAWGRGVELKELHEFQCHNATHLAENLVYSNDELEAMSPPRTIYKTKKIQEYGIIARHIGVDAVGIGVATVNKFLELNMEIQALSGGSDETAIPKDDQEKPLYKFRSARAQMYFQARIDLMNRTVRIGLTDFTLLTKLAKQLTMVRYKVSDGYIVIEKKEDIKKEMGGESPNLADSFVYWNWVRKVRTGEYTREVPVGYGETDYIPESEEPNDFHNEFENFGMGQQIPGFND